MGRHISQNLTSICFSMATELAHTLRSISAGLFPSTKAERDHHVLSVRTAQRLVVYPVTAVGKQATFSVSSLLSSNLRNLQDLKYRKAFSPLMRRTMKTWLFQMTKHPDTMEGQQFFACTI